MLESPAPLTAGRAMPTCGPRTTLLLPVAATDQTIGVAAEPHPPAGHRRAAPKSPATGEPVWDMG